MRWLVVSLTCQCFHVFADFLAGKFAHQVPAVEGEHVQGVACLVVAGEDDVALQ